MAVYVDLLAYLSIVITSQTKYSEPPSQGSIWETCEIFEENRKKKEIRERSKVWIKGMIISVIAYWRKIEPLWCIFSKNAWVSCMYNAEKVAHVVEEVNRRRDMIHQDAGNLNKIEYTNTFPGPGWSKMGCEYLSRELREREVLE